MESYSKIILHINYQGLASLRSLSALIIYVMVLWNLRQEGSAKSPSLIYPSPLNVTVLSL